jgi:predicted Zn-dependent peptidase
MISKDELKMVTDYLIGMFPLQIETPSQVASAVVNIRLYDLPKDYYDTYRSKVGAITSKDLHDAAKKYIHPESAAIVIAGNIEAIRKSLEKFGPIEIFDADGQRLRP